DVHLGLTASCNIDCRSPTLTDCAVTETCLLN
ncbi:hypothetical protein KIPB_013875, partial [Kipferlia bialata]